MTHRLATPPRLVATALCCAMSVSAMAAAAAVEQKRSYNLPSGDAATTLNQFAGASGQQIVFMMDKVIGERTNAVVGEYAAREALDRMLAGTGLSAARDPATGAFVVTRKSAKREVGPASDPKPNQKTMTPPSLPARLTAALLAFVATDLLAQPGPDNAVILSPFEVRTEKDQGYTATSTLAGSRLNTSLRDTPASISVFTKEFLDDIGAINVSEALEYSLNGSRDSTDMTGNAIVASDVLIQFRGFTGASLGRNYFGWSLASDSFNIERLDFSRGPNSILFGIGGPGGILNTSTKRARIGSAINEVRLRVGSWDDYRGTVDLGRTLIPGKLAARVNLLAQDRKSWREFDRLDRTGAALALTYRPFRHTEIRFDGEYGDVNQVVAQPWPAQERYQAWVNAGRVLSPTFGAAAAGTASNTARQFIYDPYSGLGPISWFGSRLTNTGPTSPALGNNTVAITDRSILPRGANLAGPGFTGDYHYYNYALFIEQRFGPLSLEFAANRQSEQRAQVRPQVFNDVALRIDPNSQLPDGRPNPNAGKYYTDGQLQVDYRDQIRDDGRLTASYDLDLRPRFGWLGRHTFAALWSRRENRGRNDGLNEVNLTPAGTAIYPLDLTNAANQIRRRNTIDFGSANPALRGFQDPGAFPIRNLNGVTAGLVRTRDASTNDINRTDSKMFAFQSAMFADRLILTGGLRNDAQRVWAGTADLNGNGDLNDDRDPVTRLFPRRIRTGKANYSEGDTRTYGAVFHVTKQVGVFYNNANNFVPQSDFDLNNRYFGNRRGEGEDMGVRLNLLDGRISGSVAYYKTAETNRSTGRDNAFLNAINAIWQTLNRVDLFPPANSRDTVDTEGKGWEYDFTANPTPNWRLSVNFSQTQQITANIQPRDGAYVAANRTLWQQSGTTPLAPGFTGVPTTDPAGGPATINTALNSIDALYAGFKQAEGQSRRQLREYAGNLFTSYRFRLQNGWFNGLTLGGGANYRGDAIVGYDSSRKNAPILGGAYTLVNLMAATELKLKGKQRLRLQLNVDNALGEDALIVTDADQIRAYRYVFQNPRRWSITSTLTF